MKVKVVRRDLLKDLLSNITTEFVEVTYGNGIYVVQPKYLQCVQCGCTDESRLVVKNGVHLCTKCIRSEVM